MIRDVCSVTTIQEWDALEPRWNALLDESSSRSVFLTWEWLRTWWEAYATFVGAEGLNVLVAQDADGIVAIAPLYWRRAPAYGLGRLRELRLIGDGSEDSDYLDFIVRAGREAEALSAFVAHLERQPWDVLYMNLVPAASPNPPLLRALASRYGYRVVTDEFACTAVDLPATWDEYLSTLQSRFRTKLRSLLRRLPTEHDVAFERCDEPAEVEAALESMFGLHQQRWAAAGEPGSFALAERRAFYHAVSRRFLERDWLRFFRLRVDDRPVAYEFNFEYGGRMYYLQQGHDIALGHLSVGTALKAHVLRDGMSRGVQAYDFLGDDADHKLMWGAVVGRCSRTRIARSGVRTRWALWLPATASRVRARLRDAAPLPLMRLKRRLQRALRGARPASS